jgi:response regulator RpfG family c-di-GMP phosphodiesterase
MRLNPQQRIVLIYVVLGGLWIFLSDLFIDARFAEPAARATAQLFKGWGYVLVTGVLLYFLIRHAVRRMESANRALVDTYDQTIRGLMAVLDLRHQESRNHTQRVTAMTVEFARLAGVSGADLVHLERGAVLHDVGKVGIPDSILIKPGPLTPAERELMSTHAQIGHDLLASIDFLRPAIDIPYCHHERWDGKGYPRGLSGEQIPLPARLFAIVDVWDALSFERVYKEAWPQDEVLGYLAAQAGRQFDPTLVRVFVDHIDRIRAAGDAADVAAAHIRPADDPTEGSFTALPATEPTDDRRL